MLLSKRQSIEDLIVEVLATKPNIEGPQLVSLVKRRRSNSTKQAVYYALKALLNNEIVSKAGSNYLLSRVWLNQIKKLFSLEDTKDFANEAVLALKDKQSISYKFPTLMACEKYWAHIFDLFMVKVAPNSPIFVWNPHEWFAIGREKVEREVFRAFKSRGRYAFYTVYGDTPLDHKFKEEWSNSHVTICANSAVKFSENYYLNIFEDFLLEVYIDKSLAKLIDNFYRSNHKLGRQESADFVALIERKFSVRMKLSRDTEKANKLRRKLASEYLIPKKFAIQTKQDQIYQGS